MPRQLCQLLRLEASLRFLDQFTIQFFQKTIIAVFALLSSSIQEKNGLSTLSYLLIYLCILFDPSPSLTGAFCTFLILVVLSTHSVYIKGLSLRTRVIRSSCTAAGFLDFLCQQLLLGKISRNPMLHCSGRFHNATGQARATFKPGGEC